MRVGTCVVAVLNDGNATDLLYPLAHTRGDKVLKPCGNFFGYDFAHKPCRKGGKRVIDIVFADSRHTHRLRFPVKADGKGGFAGFFSNGFCAHIGIWIVDTEINQFIIGVCIPPKFIVIAV